MAFNLKKNEGPAGPSGKKNFDLSKAGRETPAAQAKKPRYGLYGLIGLVLVAGVWYWTGRSGPGKLPAVDPLVSAAQPDTAGATDTGQIAAQADLPSDSAAVRASKPGAPELSSPVVAASFSAGSAGLPEGSAKASVTEIKRRLSHGEKVQLKVFGYASSEGFLEANQAISQARADAFKRLLVAEGVAERSITALGRGIDNPVASNDTEAGRKKNRRVEVLFSNEN